MQRQRFWEILLVQTLVLRYLRLVEVQGGLLLFPQLSPLMPVLPSSNGASPDLPVNGAIPTAAPVHDLSVVSRLPLMPN